MIRKLRRQFNRITILMLILVLLIPLIGVNLLTRFVSYQQTDTLLQQIAESSSYGLPEAKPPFEQAQKNPQEPANPPAPPNDDKKEEPAPPLRQTINSLNETINVPLMCSMILPSI